METMRLGRTGMMVSRTSFGVLPIQRTPMPEAVRILRRAFDSGINFYDTARGYTDSEQKIGSALHDVRDRIFIATKSLSLTRDGLLRDLETSLRELRTDYVDVLQIHNPRLLPDPDDAGDYYAGMLEARQKGMTRFLGLTNHSLEIATRAAESGLFDTIQFPLCHISSPADLALSDLCRRLDLGLIAMKPLSGGLLTEARTAFSFFRQYDNIVPIWGFQRMDELEEMLDLEAGPPALDDRMLATIERDRRELSDEFCRACGYCLPCPADIQIPMVARMSLILKRMPAEQFLTPEWREKMNLVESCVECGNCRERCPYELVPPALMRKSLRQYEEHLENMSK